MSEITVVCSSCGKSFTVQPDASAMFCTYCGASHILKQATEPALTERLSRIVEPSERVAAFETYVADHPGDDQAALLGELFALRYSTTGGRKKMTADAFLRLWFDLVIYSKKYDRRSEAKMAAKELDQFFKQDVIARFGQGSPAQRALLEGELRHAVYAYFDASRQDRNYTSGILNIFALKKGNLMAKAANETVLGSVAILHAGQRTEQYGVLISAAKEAFLMAYPDGLADYNRIYNEWKEKTTN